MRSANLAQRDALDAYIEKLQYLINNAMGLATPAEQSSYAKALRLATQDGADMEAARQTVLDIVIKACKEL